MIARHMLGVVVATAAFSIAGLPGMVSQAAAQDTHLLVVSGLGGEPRFQRDFVAWGSLIRDAALAAGVQPEHAIFLAEDPEVDPERIRGRSTRDEVEAAFREIGTRTNPEDRVLVVLIGHGSGSGEDSMVSLPGPSLRASDYDRLMDELSPRTVALVNVASASGDFARVLAGENRVVVTATRSSGQRNATLFGLHFAEALAGEGADLDRDGRVSLLEAFEYARRETERHYSDRGLIQSEQALLEDRPEGDGAAEPGDHPDLGNTAARFFLQPQRAARAPDDPAAAGRLNELREARGEIERELANLRSRADAMDSAEYQEALQDLLVRLSRVSRDIRELEEGAEG